MKAKSPLRLKLRWFWTHDQICLQYWNINSCQIRMQAFFRLADVLNESNVWSTTKSKKVRVLQQSSCSQSNSPLPSEQVAFQSNDIYWSYDCLCVCLIFMCVNFMNCVCAMRFRILHGFWGVSTRAHPPGSMKGLSESIDLPGHIFIYSAGAMNGYHIMYISFRLRWLYFLRMHANLSVHDVDMLNMSHAWHRFIKNLKAGEGEKERPVSFWEGRRPKPRISKNRDMFWMPRQYLFECVLWLLLCYGWAAFHIISVAYS